MSPPLEEMQAQIGDYRGPLHQAPISLADHGFLYGDAVYETMRTLGGQLLEWSAHMRRLRESARGIYLDVPWSDQELSGQVEGFRIHLGGRDHYIRMIVTRGAAPLGYAHDPRQRPQLILIGGPFHPLRSEEMEAGLRATVVTRRRNSRQALSPHLKTNNLLNPRLATMEAREAGFDEALLLNADGNFTEGSTCNVFFARRPNLLVTPHPESGLLLGVTRQLLLDLARAGGMQVEERAVAHEELAHFHEAFLCSTTRTVVPLKAIDDWPMDPCGPVTRRVMELFVERFGEL